MFNWWLFYCIFTHLHQKEKRVMARSFFVCTCSDMLRSLEVWRQSLMFYLITLQGSQIVWHCCVTLKVTSFMSTLNIYVFIYYCEVSVAWWWYHGICLHRTWSCSLMETWLWSGTEGPHSVEDRKLASTWRGQSSFQIMINLFLSEIKSHNLLLQLHIASVTVRW